MREYGIGQSVPRSEDIRLVRGRGRYTDDFAVPGQSFLYLLRSPHAAARIRSIDTTHAKAAPGVIGIFTGQDTAADGLGTFTSRVKRKRRDGRPNFEPPFRVLAFDRVHHVGVPVVAIVAESLAQAKDAAELVEVDYEVLDSVTATEEAARPGAPAVWDEVPDNVCFVYELGDKAAADAAFARAAHVATLDFTVERVTTNAMEMRNAIGAYDESNGRYTLTLGAQAPHQLRTELAEVVLKIPQDRLRVISPDVGGGFGMKGGAYPEWALALWTARKVGRPVRWQAERSESFVSDFHARDNVSRVELALDKDGIFLGLRIATTANLGAYLAMNGVHVPTNNLGGLSGTYRTPHIFAEVTGVFTNTNPTAPYRGAGRPEASYAVERVIDIAAREMGMDRVDLRRRNLIPSSAMPYKTGFVYTYDSGEFEQNMDTALTLADWAGYPKRAAQARVRGKLSGIAVVNVIEIAGGPHDQPMEEGAEIRFDSSGDVSVFLGSHSHGQGHETVFAQIIHDQLGVPIDRVRVVYGDTDQVYHGKGTFGSRTAVVGSTAVVQTVQKIIERGKQIAAHRLEASTGDLEFVQGAFKVVGTDRSITIEEVAKSAFVFARLPKGMDLGLSASTIVAPPGATFPNGCHVCEVEVDPDTGTVDVVSYCVIDDVGRVLNPLLVKGQLHGGIAQGLGEALIEAIVYDRDSGQLVTGSFMDYAMPRAEDIPVIKAKANEVLTPMNPLGVKGAGEAGTVGALPAIMNAIVDALTPLGVKSIDMPATPERVWRAIQAAKQDAA
ncbi:MAG TPA: xanthine dehydrogenase family protein molybdopterin-binding subunit [Xanthobacteraceae bacterium]|jgi:carbon-monoxide dehydrogenase large subunit|nr:xanthine dehydrogenase family protein molybdopterin-binding subunit [Xanthobacteraceae bacterium]